MLCCLALALAVVLTGCGGDGGNPVNADNDDNNLNNPTPLQWELTQRTPAAELLRSIDGLGDVHIAVGNGGLALIRQGNDDWRVASTPSASNLRRVEMVDEKTALAVGTNVILRTADGGSTWKTAAEPGVVMNDVSASGKFAIAVGSNTILVSDDAGETWKAPSGTFLNAFYTRVDHHTDQIATALAAGPTLFRTTDGGQNWTPVTMSGLTSVPADIAFFSEKLGCASQGGDMFFTSDGGETWNEAASFGINAIMCIDEIDATTAFAMTSSGHIHITENAGKSWSFETQAPPEFSILNAVDASDPSHWYAAGPIGFLTETVNAGTSWQAITQGRAGSFLDVAFADADVGIAAFSPRDITAEKALRTVDGGLTWDAIDPQIKRPEHAELSPSGVGLLIGSNEVSRSNSFGASWVAVSPPNANDALRGGAIFDDLTYVVCGDNAGVWRTTDAGATWQDVSFDASTDRYEDVAFLPGSSNAVMVSEDKSYRSTDAGATWAVINLKALAVACPAANVAVAVGDEILRSSDGGQSFDIVAIPGEQLLAVAFADALHGVAAGAKGLVMETLDGGLTWSEADAVTSLTLESASFRGTEGAAVGGRDGVVLMGTP
jgi:photosystem II stability/assembly factor-like uncharacterized protein